MSTKALRKELFAAVAMLIVAAIALSGSTYAWFAANTTVKAEDMQVTVTSDTTFLLIGQDVMSVTDVQNAQATTTSASITDAAIMPVAHKTATLSNIAAVEVDAEGSSNEWYYTYSDDPTKSTSGALDPNFIKYSSAKAIAGVPGGYILENTFSLTVAQGANEIHDLMVSDCAITSTSNAAVKVIVATDEGAQEFAAETAAGTTTTSGITTLAAIVSSGAVKLVKIYVYWDGNDQDVFTKNIANLKDTSVVVTFKGTAAPQN